MKIVLKALYIPNQDYIEVNTTDYNEGTMWTTKTEFIYSRPKGNWDYLEFSRENEVSLVNFLDVMVQETMDVIKMKVKLILDETVEDNAREIVNAIPKLDPTFIPPDTNPRCRWQNDLLKDICHSSVYYVVATCRNQKRLKKFFKFISLLVEE